MGYWRKDSYEIRVLAQSALFAALAYVGFQFFRIDIPVGDSKTAFHLGNTFVVLAGLLIGNPWGAIGGAIGLTIADLTSGYAISSPKTFVLKLIMGLITGFLAHNVFRIAEQEDAKKRVLHATISCAAALALNIVLDPWVGYLYKQFILGQPQDAAKTLAKMAAVTTFVNSIVSTICAGIFFAALYPALSRANLLAMPRYKKKKK